MAPGELLIIEPGRRPVSLAFFTQPVSRSRPRTPAAGFKTVATRTSA